MGDRGHKQHRPKTGGRAPFRRGELGPHLTQRRWAEAYLRTKWHLDPSSRLATIDMGRKFGLRPFWGRCSWAPSNTMSLGLRPISLPSGMFIHPAIWPQQIWAKKWGAVPPGKGSWAPHLAQCRLGRDLPPCQVAS